MGKTNKQKYRRHIMNEKDRTHICIDAKRTFKAKQILCSIHDTLGREYEYVSRYRVANMHMYS